MSGSPNIARTPDPRAPVEELRAVTGDKPDPPFKAIAGLLKSGKVVPFLGAGANFAMRELPGSEWHEDAPFLPSGAELSSYLATESSFPFQDEREREDLAKVSSYYAEAVGRDLLRECLYRVFARDYAPGIIHDYLASIEKPLLIVTTNYDDLTEKAFAKAGRPYYLVSHLTDREDWAEAVLWWKHDPDNPEAASPAPVHPSDLNKYVDLDTTTVIYKMHGTVDAIKNEWNSYVITEDDYVDFLARMTEKTAVPPMFMKHCDENRQFLFLGYGLKDWNFRVVLRDLMKRKRGRRSWAIQVRPTRLEARLWDNRGVDIYDMDINTLVERLSMA
ncbi:MAG TPA: SIR2 family protein [Blastocatellia bacterium]|nr:SIR2 family protein [Blastocatellia bacterium]